MVFRATDYYEEGTTNTYKTFASLGELITKLLDIKDDTYRPHYPETYYLFASKITFMEME